MPTYLLKSVENGINQKKTNDGITTFADSMELLSGCEQCINIDWKLDHMVLIVKQLLLLLIHNCLDYLIGDDVFTLINKCIVLDHLGNRMYEEANFLMLLKKLNKKIKDSVLDSVQEANVQQVVGNINYRLNKYKEAISSLCKFLDRYLENNKNSVIQISEMEKVLVTLISIAYCYEKMNTEESLSKAINLLENVKLSKEIELSKIDIERNRVLSKKISIQLMLCNDEIQTEIYHALSHFYNERAIFHHNSNTQEDDFLRENDILNARKYISIAKSRDKENAFHSCHGLICYESTNYWYAITLYKEALQLEAVNNDLCLKNGLLFYLAQSEYAVGNQKSAENHLKEFVDFCNQTNNEDALAHAGIMQIKSELSRLDLFSNELTALYFHDKLEFITKKKLSLYVPVSIQHEWKKIVYAINIFYYIYRIFKKEISLTDGIEEIVYNLGRYSDKNNEIKNPPQIKIHENKIKKNVTKSDIKDKDRLYLLEYKGIRLLCLGNYFDLPRSSSYKIGNLRGVIENEHEEEIILQLEASDRPDVLLFTPSESFSCQPGRKDLLTRILKSKACIITKSQKARNLASECNEKGVSNIYFTETLDMFLQMGFYFRVYELLRYDLATPTPLLGLAPLGESKSYTYQAGIKTKELLVPTLNNAKKSSETNSIKRTLTFLDRKRIEMLNGANSIIDYQCVIKSNISVIQSAKEVSFIAFFPNPTNRNNDLGYFTAPFIISNDNVFGFIKYIPPFKKEIIYSYPIDIFSTYKLHYYECATYLSDPPFCMNSCADEEGNDCDIESFANETCLTTSCRQTDAIIKLLQHIIPIYEISHENYHCLWRKITIINNKTSGILIIIININYNDKEILLHNICKSITTEINENPKEMHFDDFESQSKIVNLVKSQPKITKGTIEKSNSLELLSPKLNKFVKNHFKSLESKREKLYKYWEGQVKDGKDSAFNIIPNKNIKKLQDISEYIEVLENSWINSPPQIINSESDLQNIWNSDPNYQIIMNTLKKCEKSN